MKAGKYIMDEQIIQNQVALFNLMSALVHKLTGQLPNVRIRLKDGSYLMVTPSLSNVILMGEDSQYSYPHQKENAKDYQPRAFSDVS